MNLPLLTALLLSPSAQAAPLKVLVTSFQAYNGRSANGSEEVAKQLTALSKKGGVEFVNCTLPVEFEEAGRLAIECYEKQNPKPDLVISMGESPNEPCRISLEESSSNLMIDGMFSEAPGDGKKKRFFEKIEPKGPDIVHLTLPIADMFCATESTLNPRISPSASTGSFVCNEVSYRMARYLKPKKVPFGFVHVPAPELCKESSASAAESAKRIRTMALAAAQALGAPGARFEGALPLPCETPAVAEELVRISENTTAACKALVNEDLRQRIAREREFLSPAYRDSLTHDE